MERHVLIIETGSSLTTNLGQHLRQEGFGVAVAAHMADAADWLAAGRNPVVLLGLDGLKRDGIAILGMIRKRFPRVKVITINAGEQLEFSIEAMRLGAYDDFLIPFDLDALLACIRKAHTPGEPEGPAAEKA